MRKIYLFSQMISLLLIFINSDFSMREANAENIYGVTYKSDIYEPVDGYTNITVKGSVLINSGPPLGPLVLKYDLYSPYKYGDEESYKSAYVSKSFMFSKKREINYSFNLNDDKNYARKGIKVRFGLYHTLTNTYLDYIDRYLYNKEDIYIDIDDINPIYEIDRCFSLNSNNVSEKYHFSNFSHILELENYYRLDLSSLYFRYDYHKDYKVESASLSFIDTNNVFPYIDGEDNKKKIPLTPYINNKIVYFGFKNIYVHPKTLDMSLTYKEGFIETNYFYLPKNQLRLLQGSLFALNIYRSGVNLLCFDYDFTIYVDSLLLGPCNEAAYCVVGGIKR